MSTYLRFFPLFLSRVHRAHPPQSSFSSVWDPNHRMHLDCVSFRRLPLLKKFPLAFLCNPYRDPFRKSPFFPADSPHRGLTTAPFPQVTFFPCRTFVLFRVGLASMTTVNPFPAPPPEGPRSFPNSAFEYDFFPLSYPPSLGGGLRPVIFIASPFHTAHVLSALLPFPQETHSFIFCLRSFSEDLIKRVGISFLPPPPYLFPDISFLSLSSLFSHPPLS